MESRYGRHDQQPQQNYCNERQVWTVQPEEDRRPGGIQHQLHEINREGQYGSG
jgi:hypothetical protein